MTDELLPYYQKELAFIRRLGAEFAESNPKIAGRLRMNDEGTDDPHVGRLIEAFAYLNARTRHKLEDDFPEITDSLLGVLYPHYQRPVPAMSIVQCVADPAQGQLTTGYKIPRGTAVETEPIDGEPCRFQTCYPVQLWPFEVREAALHGRPFQAPATRHSGTAAAVLHLVLECTAPEVNFRQFDLQRLRFFLKGQSSHAHAMHELLLNGAVEIAMVSSNLDREPIVLRPENLRPVGFERDEGMLPYPARSFLGYRLLTEYFAFPEKYMFVDLVGLNRSLLVQFEKRLEIFVYLERTSADLEHHVDADMFRLGCTPIINLFTQRAEPLQLSHTEHEYRVVPDARRPLAYEVYSIDQVTASSPDGDEIEFQPFYSFRHAAAARRQRTFWYAARRPASSSSIAPDEGTELFLSFVDLGFSPSAPADWTVDIQTTCLNRDLPHRLPFGGDQPRMSIGGAPLSRLVCLTAPTRTFRPALKHGAMWRLVSHLSLNHLSLQGEKGLDAFREILNLYDFADSAATRARIQGLVGMSSRRVVGRSSSGPTGGFCKGVEMTLQFDETAYTDHGLFLFASVLEAFLGMYCSVNSFTKTIATTKQREGELRRWPPRAGEKALV